MFWKINFLLKLLSLLPFYAWLDAEGLRGKTTLSLTQNSGILYYLNQYCQLRPRWYYLQLHTGQGPATKEIQMQFSWVLGRFAAVDKRKTVHDAQLKPLIPKTSVFHFGGQGTLWKWMPQMLNHYRSNTSWNFYRKFLNDLLRNLMYLEYFDVVVFVVVGFYEAL